jgi:hypothetical protein
MSEPKCIEVGVSMSQGSKVQLVKFELQADYHLSFSRKYSIPEDWSDLKVTEFQAELQQDLREQLEPLAQRELDDLAQQRSELNS